jgi:hypothetical protein
VIVLIGVAEDQDGTGATEDASKTTTTALDLAAAKAEGRRMNDIGPIGPNIVVSAA